MASLRKLRRRLLAWDRYAARINYQLGDPLDRRWTAYDRADCAVANEQRRRQIRAVYWPTVTTLPIDRSLL